MQNFKNWATGSISDLNTRVNGLQNWINGHNDWAGGLSNRVSSLESWRTGHDSFASNLSSRIWTNSSNIDSLFSGLNRHVDILNNHASNIDWLAGRITENSNGINTNKTNIGNLNNAIATHTSNIDWLAGRITENSKLINSHTSNIEWLAGRITENSKGINTNKTNIGNLSAAVDKHTSNIDWLAGRITENSLRIDNLNEWKEDHDKWAKNLNEIVVTHTSNINWLAGRITENSLDIVELNKKIDAIPKWSDVSIIAAIVAAMKSNENLWTGEGDGYKTISGQMEVSRLRLAGLLKLYFDMDDKDSAIYRLRYSIVAGFEETRILLADKLPKIIESQVTANTYLSAISTWLELQDKHFKTIHSDLVIVTQWLKALYEKTAEPVVLPPLVIPPIEISESDNGWLRTLIETVGDVMKTAIETLGTVLKTAIEELGGTARAILEFLDGLLDDIIHLIVPENMDFVNDKFDGLSAKIKVKFGDIFSGIDSFKGLLGSRTTFQDIEISLGSFGYGSFTMPLSIFNTFAPIIKPLVTGFVALQFLIDMYKWFHTRGEVVE